VTLRTAAALLAVPLAIACGKPPAAPRQRPPPAVTSAEVTVRDVPVEIRSPIDLRPLQQADVGAKTIGWLDAVLVDRGDRVKRGQLLALVRPSDLPDQLAAARGQLGQLQAQLALARANYERGQQLAPTGFVSQQDLQVQKTAVESAEAALAAAQSNVGVLATRLGETRIESPMDGYVSARRLDPGALIGPSSGNSIIVTIQRMDVLRVFVPVNEREVVALRNGQDAHLELDAMPGRTIQGKVVRISPSLDPGSRTVDAEIQVPNPDGLLRPGMYGRAAIVTDVHPRAIVIPATAAQLTNGKFFAFVVGPGEAPAEAGAPAAPAGGGGQPAAAGQGGGKWPKGGGGGSWPKAGGQGGTGSTWAKGDPAKGAGDPKPGDPPAGGGWAKGGGGQGGPLPGKMARVHRVQLEIGVDGGDWLEVTQGLKPGDEIVTAGMDVLADGALVRALKGVDPFTGRSVETARAE
jgi:membrane fusion protein (multidrug efflux system)